jgi:uncharacterized protein GlcG (DUF336 family)
LTGAEAARMIDASVKKAEELGCPTMTIAVLDAGGHTLAVARMDDRWFEVEFAVAKAFAAIALRQDTSTSGDLLDSSPLWRTMPNLLDGRGSFGLGGVVVRRAPNGAAESDEDIVGAVGAVGGNGPQDEAVARAGLAVVASSGGS